MAGKTTRLLSAAVESDEFKFLRRLPWEKLAIWASFLLLLWVLRRFFTIIFLTFILSYIGHALVAWACRKLGHDDPSGKTWRVATVGVFVALLGLMVGLGIFIVPSVLGQAREFAEKFAPDMLVAKPADGALPAPEGAAVVAKPAVGRAQVLQIVEKLLPASFTDPLRQPNSPYHRTYHGAVDAITDGVNAQAPHFKGWAAALALQFLAFLFNFVIAYIFALLILLDLPRITAKVQLLAESNLKKFYDEIAPGMLAFGNGMGRAFEAQTMIALVNTAFTAVGLWALGVPLLAVLSVIVFFCSFIPVLGVFISTAPIALMALNYNGPGTMLAAMVLIVVIHLIEAYILNPRIMGHVMHMHPLLVLVILFLGEHLFGVWGLLLGVPTCHYVFTYFIQRARPPTPSGVFVPPASGPSH